MHTAEVFSEGPDISRSYRLPNRSSIFQTEILAIWKKPYQLINYILQNSQKKLTYVASK